MGACTHLHMSKLINPLSKHSSYERCTSPYCINLHTCAEIAMLRPCLICGYLMYLIFSIASWPLPPLVCADCWCFPCCVLFCSSLAITLPAAAYLRKFGAKYWRHLFCFNVIYKYLYKLLCLNNICITWRFVLPVLCSFLFFIGHHFTSSRLFKKIWCKILAPSFLF